VLSSSFALLGPAKTLALPDEKAGMPALILGIVIVASAPSAPLSLGGGAAESAEPAESPEDIPESLGRLGWPASFGAASLGPDPLGPDPLGAPQPAPRSMMVYAKILVLMARSGPRLRTRPHPVRS